MGRRAGGDQVLDPWTLKQTAHKHGVGMGSGGEGGSPVAPLFLKQMAEGRTRAPGGLQWSRESQLPSSWRQVPGGAAPPEGGLGQPVPWEVGCLPSQWVRLGPISASL